MIAAQILSLTRRRVLMGSAAILPLVTVLIVIVIRVLLHSNSPVQHERAGGGAGYDATLQGVNGIVGLIAVVLGATVGSCDAFSGVIRDLISTGRSRTRLVLERLPAPVLVAVASSALGLLASLAAGAIVSGDQALPSLGAIARDLAGLALVTSTLAVIACGIASLIGSRGITIGVILGWLLLGETALTFALKAFSEGSQGVLLSAAQTRVQDAITGGPQTAPAISLALAISALAAWVAVSVGLGAFRTARKEW